jgi:uncharacterized membrane protein YhaH (DUF805 family)
MNFQQAVQSCLAKYAAFSGRAARAEFWYWQLFLVVAGLIAEIFDFGIGWRGSPLGSIFWLVTLLPTLTVGTRRLHDVGRSGWWIFLFFIPLIGAIVLIVWYCGRGTVGPNRFGPDMTPAS